MKTIDRRNFLKGAGLGAVALSMRGKTALSEPVTEAASAAASECFKCDVCVLGGSCTGVFAAVRAAERGCTVALVENEGFFGGMAVGGYVPVWHSLYDTAGKKRIIAGLTAKIESELLSRGEAILKGKDDPSVGAYLNVQGLSLALDALVAANPRIRPFLHARVVAARKGADGTVTHAVIEDKSGRRAIAAKFFIDATGDADFAVYAGLPTWKLPRTDMQAHTICAILSGIHGKRKRGNVRLDRVFSPEGGADLKHCFWWHAPVVGCPSLTFVAGTRVSGCDPSDADDLTRGEMESRAQLRRIVDAANRLFPAGKGEAPVSVAAIAPMLGLRESRHVDSLCRVTRDDVLSGRRWDDVAARGSYRIDIHEGDGITFFYLDGRREKMVRDADGKVRWDRGRWSPRDAVHATWYEVPYRALVPKGSQNVVCAGRMVDAERDAYGALRVMVNCNQMGETCGLAAARAVRESLSAPDAYAGMAD